MLSKQILKYFVNSENFFVLLCYQNTRSKNTTVFEGFTPNPTNYSRALLHPISFSTCLRVWININILNHKKKKKNNLKGH